MRAVLVWTVRLCGLVGWVAVAVACAWLLGVGGVPRPWNALLVWGAVAAGCAVVRAGALWGVRRLGLSGGGVSLNKAHGGGSWASYDRLGPEVLGRRRPPLGYVLGRHLDSRGWIRGRSCAVWLLVGFASAALFVGLLAAGSRDDRVDALRDAGARVSSATVVERPGGVREDLSEDVVRGYSARLVVAVSGGSERLAVKGAYTFDKPRAGTEVEVLWAPSAPELGGYVHERKDLRALAGGRWSAFSGGADGRDALVAFVLVMVIGCVLAAVFTFTAGPGALQRLAWAPGVQTVRAALIVAVFLGWRPFLLGDEASLPEELFAGGGFILVLLVYVFTSVGTIGDD
ncbi:hypothetical protein R6V09_27715 [Streptomyces sp. W16]|uniref:hypothetical protein n=1 Tax=Streptomyces sp. W16 TaxID=3076631 RepID=UPI00295B9EA7|nr:hypothetical protein [Streptomyces sp. W16]MDV9173881.1 hypothetical protein [Streptomyces sp. W16]